MNAKFKLISSNNFELFEERLDDFVAGLGSDDVIVDVKFSTSALDTTIEYSALIHYQRTESWG